MALTGVMLDSREPSHIQSLRFGGVPAIVTTLDCGDCWASTDDGAMLCIERKTPSDLLGSIKDGRLFAQVAAMRERSQWSYLIVTGLLAPTLDGMTMADGRTTGWRWDAVQGALLDCQELGVSLLHCQSDAHYEEAIIRLARRSRKDTKPIKPRVQPHVLSDAEKILISLPGVGLDRAKLLVDEFESAASAIAWLTWLNTYHDVAGIGDGTKHSVRKALGLKPEEWITIMYPEAIQYAQALDNVEITPKLPEIETKTETASTEQLVLA